MRLDKQCALERLLNNKGTVSHNTLQFPKHRDVAGSIFEPEIKSVYQTLGGVLPAFPLNLRDWDMVFDGVAVEFDEYLHFNRYRSVTLKSASYARLSGFPMDAYERYCSEGEKLCLRNGGGGGRWSNASCVTQFGEGALRKDLGGNGAPRWKQRAFYDFVKDLSPLLIDVTVVRIAVWDAVVDGVSTRTVEEILEAPSETSSAALAALVRQRASGRAT
jgi:hypothetical protein